MFFEIDFYNERNFDSFDIRDGTISLRLSLNEFCWFRSTII